MKRSLGLLGLSLWITLVAAGDAQAADRSREDAILMESLAQAKSTGELIKTVVTRLRTELRTCPNSRAQSPSLCIQTLTKKMVDRAFADKKLDRVEKTVLKRVFSMTVITGTDIVADPAFDPGAHGKGIEQPNLYTYRERKQQFRELRKAKGQPEDLDPAVAAEVEKAYLRKMKGVGRVSSGAIGAEEYLASRFSRLQLNTLSGLLVELIDRMSHSSGRIVLDRPDYASRAERIETLEREVVNLTGLIAQAGPDELPVFLAQLAEKREALAKEKQGMRADQLLLLIEAKKAERDAAVDAVLADGIEVSERVTRAARVEELDREVLALEKQLDDEREEISLPPSDVDRIAVKALKIELRKAMERGQFQGQKLEFGDVVMAAWVSGEIDSELLKACLEMDALGEPRETVLKKLATRSWPIIQAVATVNPISEAVVTIASIVLTSLEEAKKRKQEEADEGSLVRE